MFDIEIAENKDVDVILDCKLDITFNSSEVLEMDQNQMEKIVNYCEEEIRENIQEYRMVYEQGLLIAIYGTSQRTDGIIIDTIYVMPHARNTGIGSKLMDKILSENYKPLFLWVDKGNSIAIDLFKKYNFKVDDESDYKYYMKYENIKESNDSIKLKLFEEDVKKLAKQYNVEYELSCRIKQ